VHINSNYASAAGIMMKISTTVVEGGRTTRDYFTHFHVLLEIYELFPFLLKLIANVCARLLFANVVLQMR
jgi:hypothetical protein